MTDRGIEITSNQDILDHASDMFTDMDDWEYDDDIEYEDHDIHDYGDHSTDFI